jgi:hypothetical protein
MTSLHRPLNHTDQTHAPTHLTIQLFPKSPAPSNWVHGRAVLHRSYQYHNRHGTERAHVANHPVVGRFAGGHGIADATAAAAVVASTRVGSHEMMDALGDRRYGGTRGAFDPLHGTSCHLVHCPRFFWKFWIDDRISGYG